MDQFDQLLKNHPETRAVLERMRYINPPPRDECCQGCGRHVSSLEPVFDVEPIRAGYGVHKKRLLKTFREVYRETGDFEAFWLCQDCLATDFPANCDSE